MKIKFLPFIFLILRYLSLHLYICLSDYTFVCISFTFSLFLSLAPSLYLSVCVSLWECMCMCVLDLSFSFVFWALLGFWSNSNTTRINKKKKFITEHKQNENIPPYWTNILKGIYKIKHISGRMRSLRIGSFTQFSFSFC